MKFGIIEFEPICKMQRISMDSLTGKIDFQDFKISIPSLCLIWNIEKCKWLSRLKRSCYLEVVSKKERKCLGIVLTLVSTALPRLLLSETATSTKTLLSQSVTLITRYKSGAILFWDNIFPKNATLKLSIEMKIALVWKW